MSSNKRAVKTDDFTRLNIYSDPQVSPTKNGFAFVSTIVNEKKKYSSTIHFYNLEQKQTNKWTYTNKKDQLPKFSPCGKYIAFQSTRSGRPQIWLMPTDGGEAKQITTFTYGAMNPHWTNDGQSIIFIAPLEHDADVATQKELSDEEYKQKQEEKRDKPLIVNCLKYKSDALGFHDDKRTQIIMYDIEEETFTQLTSGTFNHYIEDISPDGQYVLFSGNLHETEDREQKSYLYTVHTATKKITKLTKEEGAFAQAKYSPSGQYIAYIGHQFAYKGATLTELYILNLKTKERTCLSEAWDFAVGDYMIGDTRLGSSTTGPVWSHDEREIYFIGTRNGATALLAVNLNKELTTLYENNDHLFGFSYNEADESFILGISTPTNPGDFYLFNKETKAIERLTKANEQYLNAVALSEPEELTITAEDGWNIQGWLLKPYNFTDGKKYPFVLEVHGGPHAMYGQTYFHEMQLLAAKGYVVLYTNPRGSHGYGQKFVDAVRGDYGGSDYTDLMTAVDTALATYSFIDEDRLGVTGGSYGGFMTNWIVGHTNRFKAAVTQRSISNWLSFYGVSDIGHFFTEWELGIDLLDDPEKLWEFSPLKYAKNVETPLLILHGELDYRCPIEQAEQLFIQLKKLGKNVEFVRFPNANHELSRSGKPNMRIERLHHICRWFEQYL
ncbi:MAG TPA: S9 family peptidase [Bacillota bacterium]|nr:S9 family peptidase [Bacillota bacterium]